MADEFPPASFEHVEGGENQLLAVGGVLADGAQSRWWSHFHLVG
jgi:hypothetical protein